MNGDDPEFDRLVGLTVASTNPRSGDDDDEVQLIPDESVLNRMKKGGIDRERTLASISKVKLDNYYAIYHLLCDKSKKQSSKGGSAATAAAAANAASAKASESTT